MADITINAFYGGVQSEYDWLESSLSYTAESAGDAVGLVLGSPGAPLWNNAVQLTLNDANDDGVISSDQLLVAGETITYAGSAQQLDTALSFTADFTYYDGSSASGDVILLQDVSGRVFVVPWGVGSPNNAEYTAKAITSIQITGVTGDDYSGVGTGLANIDFTCIAGGAQVLTPDGPVAAGRIRPGDFVVTRDHGPQPVIWAGHQVVERADLNGDKRPVRLAKGAMGQGLPVRSMVLSAQHRVLLTDRAAPPGKAHALVAAKELLPVPGVQRHVPKRAIRWVNLLFDRHEVIWVEGVAVESLMLGEEAQRILGRGALAQIDALPRRADGVPRAATPAHRIVRGRAARHLVRRLMRSEAGLRPEVQPLQAVHPRRARAPVLQVLRNDRDDSVVR